MTIKIVLADDHIVVRTGLKSLIDAEADLEVVGEADDGRTAVRLAEELRPDVIVMDVAMPDLNGVEATAQITRQAPKVRVIALSMHSDRRYVSRMLEAGAAGYLLKDCAYDELTRAVRQVAAGKSFLGTGVAEQVVDEYVRRLSSARVDDRPPLTPREREVLQLIAEGRSTKEIAFALSVSVKTIETHRANIMDKLDLHSVAELTKYAVREGLTTLER